MEISSTPPRLTVVIPAYNEATTLPLTLQALKDQDYPGAFEIIVVDNRSTDLTPQIAALYGARVIREEIPGIAHARQAGFLAAVGEIICSTDADTIVPPNWLTTIVATFSKNPQLLALGGRFDLTGINSPAKLFARLSLPIAFAFDALDHGGNISGANFAVRRSAFQKINGFRTELGYGEDIDLGKRLRNIGPIKILSSLRVKTSARRFGSDFAPTFQYAITNYAKTLLGRHGVRNAIASIRERPYDMYGYAIKRPMTILFAAMVIGLLLWSSFSPKIPFGDISHVNTTEKIIALTFDDGPNEPTTNQVLRILNDKNVKATFFLVGENVDRNPEIAKDIVDHGHIVANHSYGHKLFSLALRPRDILADTERATISIAHATGKTPAYYRPPFGFRTLWGLDALKDQGYAVVTWNDMTVDYWNVSAQHIAARIIKKARPGGIIVLHDGGETDERVNRDNTVIALPIIIDELKKSGYRFVTIDELLDKNAYRN